MIFRLVVENHATAPAAPNLVQRQFQADAPDRIWVGDITFIRTRQGWLHLAILLDLFSRRVVGWSMRERPDLALVLNALNMVLGAAAAPPQSFFSNLNNELIRRSDLEGRDAARGNIRLHLIVLQPEPHASIAWLRQPGEVRVDEGSCLIRASEKSGSVQSPDKRNKRRIEQYEKDH